MANVIKSHIAPEPKDGGYAAFYYEWKNITNGMRYGGYHVGQVNDGYKHSSKNPQMISDFDNMNMEWEYSVLYYGDKEQMQDKEREILKSNEARKSDEWYNLTNGGTPYDLVSDDIAEICESISEGKWLQSDFLEKEDIQRLLSDGLQVRVNHSDPKFTKEISTLIDDKGDTSNTNPMVVYETDKTGKKVKLINGNTTGRAILDSNHGTKAKYQIIPYEKVKDFTDNEFRALGLALNPLPKIPTKPTNVPDAVAYVIEANQSGNRPVDHRTNREYLQNVLNFSSKQRRTIINEAKAQLDMGSTNTTTPLIRYAQKANKHLLQDRVDYLESKLPNTKVFAYSADMVRYGNILDWIVANDDKGKNKKVANICLLVHFASYTDIKKWQDKELSTNNTRLQSLCSKYNLGFRGIEEMSKY